MDVQFTQGSQIQSTEAWDALLRAAAIYMAGTSYGSSAQESLTWGMNGCESLAQPTHFQARDGRL